MLDGGSGEQPFFGWPEAGRRGLRRALSPVAPAAAAADIGLNASERPEWLPAGLPVFSGVEM